MATFEELTGLETTAPAARPLTTVHQSGADQRRIQGEEQAQRAEETTLGGTFGAAWERNISNMLYDTVERKWSHPAEDGFDPTIWVTENKLSLPGQNLEEFSSVRSTAEAEALRDDMIRAHENDMVVASKGYTGVAASLMAGLVDPAELAIAVGTAGYGKAATVGGRIARVTTSGLKGGVASATLAYGGDPLADSKQIVYGGLTGAVLAGTLSTVGQAYNRASMTTRRAYSQEVNDLPPADLDFTDAPAYDTSYPQEQPIRTDTGTDKTVRVYADRVERDTSSEFTYADLDFVATPSRVVARDGGFTEHMDRYTTSTEALNTFGHDRTTAAYRELRSTIRSEGYVWFDPKPENAGFREVDGVLKAYVLDGPVGRSGRVVNSDKDELVRAGEMLSAEMSATGVDVRQAGVNIQSNTAPMREIGSNPQSLGAASVNPQMDTSGFSPSTRSIYDQSMKTIRDNNLGTRMEDTDFTANTPEARVAKRFSDALSQKLFTPLRTDFDRLMYGGSRVEAAMAFNLFESPEGRIRNNRSGAMLRETYEQRLSSHSLPTLDETFSTWAKGRNMGLMDQHRPASREAFDREVFAEMEARFHEGRPVSSDPAIRKAADALDRNMDDAVAVGKGRDGEMSMSGFDEIEPKSGYIPHRWSGAAIRRALAKGHSMEKMEKLLRSGYAKTYPDLPTEYHTMISKAVLRRAMAKEDGIDTNMLKTLDSDAQDYLRDLLRDSGYDNDVIEKLIESIRGRKENASIVSAAKERKQIDLRTSADGLTLLDLVDTNMTRLVSKYNRDVAGNAALARKGIQNRAHRKDMIEAALSERRERGLPADEKQRRFLEDMFTYFDSGPIGGGVDENVSRLKRLTNLALLNQMGMTQAGEAGAQIAAVGMETWQRHAKVVYNQMRKQGPEGPIASELRPWMGEIGNEHMLFRDDLMLDELSTSRDLNTFLGKLDFALGKGQRLQGYVSGFYHVRQFQQRVAVTSMADKVFQRLRDGKDLEIMDSLGMPRTLKRYIDDGTVEFDDAGFVNKLNMDRWDYADAEEFAVALNRHTHQVVQKAMAGEEQVWMHRTVGSLYMHLKSFPLLAMRKQTARLAGVQRPQAVAALLMGLATAGLAYEARQVVNGRMDRVSPEDALSGAMGMSNMTGWVPMLTDPAAAVLGMNDLRFNRYGRHDLNTGILSVPPVIPTLNRMAQAPGAVNPWGDLTQNERIRIMQTTPIIGNLYGFSALFNGMKE